MVAGGNNDRGQAGEFGEGARKKRHHFRRRYRAIVNIARNKERVNVQIAHRISNVARPQRKGISQAGTMQRAAQMPVRCVKDLHAM